jgi:hypothetical protein
MKLPSTRLVAAVALTAAMAALLWAFIWLATHGGRMAVGFVMFASWVLVAFAPPAYAAAPRSDVAAFQDPVRHLQLQAFLLNATWALLGLSMGQTLGGHVVDGLLLGTLALAALVMAARTRATAKPPKVLTAVMLVGVLAAWPYWVTAQRQRHQGRHTATAAVQQPTPAPPAPRSDH